MFDEQYIPIPPHTEFLWHISPNHQADQTTVKALQWRA